MMDFDKRREEVFRRSEKIIKNRKRKNRALALILPFVLCSFALSLTLFPDLFLRKKNSPESLGSTPSDLQSSFEELGSDLASDSKLLSVLLEKEENLKENPQAVIDDEGALLKISKLLKLNTVSNAATSIPEAQSSSFQTDTQTISSSNRGDVSSKASGTKGPGSTYYVTLRYTNGDEITYTLKGNTLFSQYDVIKLTASEAAELKAMLDLD